MFSRDNSRAALANCTFSANSANDGGGSMRNDASSPTLTNVTFSGNFAGFADGEMHNTSSSPTLRQTIVARSAGGDCAGIDTVTSEGEV